MPKIHGGGGHGRESRERRRSYASQINALERIERAREKRSRYFDRKIEEFAIKFGEINTTATTALALIKNAATPKYYGKTINPTQSLIRLLAVDAWFHERALKEAEKLKIGHLFEPEDFHVLEFSKREELWGKLVGKRIVNGKAIFGRTKKELIEEVNKWKNRTPQMIQYT